MNDSEARDPLELDTLDVFTRARLFEQSGIDLPCAFVGYMTRLDGEVLEISFRSLASVAGFVREMNPQQAKVHCASDEDDQALTEALAALADCAVH